ncbi:Holliday junction branch migration protein RuvA [Bifidobacterium mongoliense]|uniref:Holliday junction branch migration protein RuvA n=1 Tax=Bifidobacterium mongoliense TaxID=518643 RepID=UPI0030EDE6B1
MIGMLNGRVHAVDASMALIEVGGVGYEVRMPAADLSHLHAGQDGTVYTSLSVSQDSLALYGFLTQASKRMFLQLQKVSGIGPRVALSLLSTLSPSALAKAVADGDAAALAKAPGLGKKGAQKIILELKGSINLEPDETSPEAAPPVDTGTAQVVEGLISLGWHAQDAERAVRDVVGDHDIAEPLTPKDVPRVLRLALAALDRGR